MSRRHEFQPEPFGRDACDARVDEGDGQTRQCGYKRSEHSQPEQEKCGSDVGIMGFHCDGAKGHPGPHTQWVPTAPRLPDAWRIDSAGANVRFCRPHETLTFTAQTARALAAALLVAAEEAEGGCDGELG